MKTSTYIGIFSYAAPKCDLSLVKVEGVVCDSAESGNGTQITKMNALAHVSDNY